MLKLLSLQKQRTALNVQLKQLRENRNTLNTNEDDLRAKLDALSDGATIDEVRSLNDQVTELTRQQTECDDKIADVLDELERCGAEIEKCEAEQGSVPGADESRSAAPAAAERKASHVVEGTHFRSRSMCFTSRSDMNAFYARSDVKEFLQRVRSFGDAGRRSVSGGELNIPVVMLDMMRQTMGEYSKLIGHVRLRSVKGTARQNIMGKVPDGVWTEMKGALNELEFAFNQIEMDGYKAGGFVAVDNYLLKDSDINLGEELLSGIMHAIGKALDKAIIYGTGSTGKMPVGIVTRLAQTSQPAYWGSNQGTWTDLHSSNVMKLNIGSSTGTAFFQALMTAMGKADPDYSVNKQTVWCCNRQTHMDLIGRGLAFNAAGALVAGLNDRMPAEGGVFVELDFLPDNEIVGGYMDEYVLAEREGASLAQSDQYLFVEDKTVFKGTARYDGQPAIGEGFVVINYNNTDVTTSYTFKPDYANTKMNIMVVTAAAGTASGDTVLTVSGAKADSPTLKYAAKNPISFKVGDKLPSTGWTSLTSGTTQITAAAGTPITVVELDGNSRVVSVGNVLSVPKT